MQNSTRRVKRSRRPSYQFPVSTEDGTPDLIHVRHRRAAQPDALRGTMLIALVVVILVLYILLRELERSSFALIPNPNANRALAPASPSSAVHPTSTRYRALHEGSSSNEIYNSIDDRDPPLPSKPSRPTPKWPPRITRIPGEHDTHASAKEHDDHTTSKLENLKLSSFDVAYCNGTCRFLLPIRIGEQESKARVHFMQLLALAQQLNRTIVLPNVGKSRLNACHKWHFGAYYDTNGLTRRNDLTGPRLAIELDAFTRWVDERPVPPSGFIVSMESRPRGRRNADVLGSQSGPEDASFIIDKTEADPKVLSCLESKLGRLRLSVPEKSLFISFNSYPRKTKSDASTRLVQLLSNSLNTSTDADFDVMTGSGYGYSPHRANSSLPSFVDTDVLVLDYNLRHPLFAASAQPNPNLLYAPVLYDLADRISDNLGPFLGVHWRMESVPVQNLAWCAASLVSTLHAFFQEETTVNGVQLVWLATDYPRPLSMFMGRTRFSPGVRPMLKSEDGSSSQDYGPSERSGTFKTVTPEHDDAMRILVEAFQPGGDLDAWKLTDLTEQLWRYPYVEGRFGLNETLLGDSGVFGILDKLVIVQAVAFVSGSVDCSKTSSFSKQVVDARRDLFEVQQGKGAIRNVVERFGKW